ncbi:MAG TPA: hypothetical protein VEC39_09605 [Vicinamibacterales bacterium]|nr:hypothetical protein [Vicinamibacterales bacterium]
MRQKCVHWTKSVRTVAVALAAVAITLVARPNAQSIAPSFPNDPTSLPRLAFTDIQYVGGFRLPSTMSNGESFSFGGRQLAFNPVSNTLFVGARSGLIAEVSIPGVVNTTNAAAMPFASFLQGFYDPTEGRMSQIGTEGVALDSLMVYGNRLYGTAFIYYDANNTQRASHFSRSLQLNQPSFQGWSSIWQADKTGFVSGAMAPVPPEWQPLLGGPAVTGQCCIPIVTRTSWGPAAFAFDPSKVGQSAVPGSPLLYYTGEHPTLGHWDAANPTYGATIAMGGMVLVPGTRTALYFGTIGTGTNCYGNGTADPTMDGKIGPDGEKYCYDPANSDKGSHAYPYRYQMWAYDLAEFAQVKAGTKQPWEVVPYGVWPFDLPTKATTIRLGGVGYDASTQTLYLSQLHGDQDGYSFRPVIHALRINAADLSILSPVTSVNLTADLPAPQTAGTTIRFRANASAATSVEYKWLTHDGATWTAHGSWSSASDFAVTPTTANASFKVGVQARAITSPTDTGDASAEMDFPLVSARVGSVSLTANKTAPQVPGTMIEWTANASGGSNPQYKFQLFDGVSWSTVRDWSDSKTFTWTPAVAGTNYRVSVWARSGGSTDVYDATNEAGFTIAGTPPTARVTTVTLGTSLPSPQPENTAITWVASASGGADPVYKFQLFDGAVWSTVRDWSPSNSYTWMPTAAGSNYRVSVWARSGSSTEIYEAVNEGYFTIAAPVQAPRVNRVALTANLMSPQTANTAVTFNAGADGGSNPQYKWQVFNGSSWTTVKDWSTSYSYVWLPTAAGSNYRVSVWARSSGSTEVYEASAEMFFTITAPAPPPRVSAVTLAANLASPQVVNTTIIWTATAVGGSTPEFKWQLFDGFTWKTVRDWSSVNTLIWTPTAAGPNYRVSVWARSAGSSEVYEAVNEGYFSITAPIIVTPRVTSVALTSSHVAPQLVNTTVTFTASPTGGAGPHQYQFWVFDGARWTSFPWTTNKNFTWTPTKASAKYRISVWAKSAGNPADLYEASTEVYFAIASK